MSDISAEEASVGFRFHHAMIRIRNPEKALSFYQDQLGMSLICIKRHPEWDFDLYFLTYRTKGMKIPEDLESDEARIMLSRHKGISIELTHNYGNEDSEDYIYTNGSEKNAGFGHFAISVPDLGKTCERLFANGVKFKKTPDSGRMKGFAFVYDPDGYQIELIQRK
eukprot:TRINITY_DN22540_c0_g1_i1.p1 TRINITY_DN22540_c0_g1~~TRINITY_DN22540_c0_g1_i1.p1  ORF type:complete len:166 (-),score=36.62 TRINITY_DN22540_c0_g1_i1:250-747(-)